MKYKPYHAYKDSGIDCLGEVPEHWHVKRLRFLVTMNPSKQEISHLPKDTDVSFIPMEAVGDDGKLDLERIRTIEEAETGYTYFADGDVTYAKITPCFENGKGAVMRRLVGGAGFGTTELTVLRPSLKVNSQFLYYLTISSPFRELGEGSMYGAGGQKRVPDDFARNFEIGWPDITQQQYVADFLDNETGRLDTLIEKKRQMIDLLKEKRIALIARIVTKGLDPKVTMKDSRIEWLGNVPAHWKTMRFGRCAFFQEGPGLRNWQFTDSGVRVICVTNITEAGIDFSSFEKFISEEEYLQTYRHFTVAKGDHLLSSSGNSWGKVAEFVGDELCILNTSTIRVNCNRSKVLRRSFLKWLLQSDSTRRQLGLFMTGSCQPNFGPSHLSRVVVPVPIPSEQKAIADYLGRETSKIDRMIEKVAAAIEKLTEYRTALTTAAVTGKIDVREAAT